jgi:dissimilatory sulfite reductase related protein
VPDLSTAVSLETSPFARPDCDSQGFLLARSDWTPRFAEAAANADGLLLTPRHWEIIEFVQRFFDEFNMAPPMRLLTKAIAQRLGESKGKSIYLYELFPEGPAKQACRYAGLPKPISCL